MGVRELRLNHQVSIPMSLYEGYSSCISPWFSSPEFIAKRLLLRCYFTEWEYNNSSDFYERFVSIQVVGGEVLSMLDEVTGKSDEHHKFKIRCAKAELEVEVSAPDTAAHRATALFSITNGHLCTPTVKDILIPPEIHHYAEEGAHLGLNIRVTLLVPDEPSLHPYYVQQSASETMQRMLSEGLHSDVQLQLQGGVLHAHRAVLAACSPVFRAMFQHDMKESQSGQVDMPDVPLAAMEAAVKFLYGGELTSHNPELWMQLLELAERYQLTPLKALCEANLCVMVMKLPSELLLRLLVLADQHSVLDLRSAALSRLATCKEVDIDVRDLVKSHPDVAEEVIKFFLDQWRPNRG